VGVTVDVVDVARAIVEVDAVSGPDEVVAELSPGAGAAASAGPESCDVAASGDRAFSGGGCSA
jgi:ribosomal protein L12E/L44/L45/RPP1/RPP2